MSPNAAETLPLSTGAHVLHMSAERGGSILTNGSVFPSCECGKWRINAMSRQSAREQHADHLSDVVAKLEAKRG